MSEPLSVPEPDTPVLREQAIAALLNAYAVKEAEAEATSANGGRSRGD